MKKVLAIFFLTFILDNLFASEYYPCKLIFSDSTTTSGKAKFPNMYDKTIKFIGNESLNKNVPSENLNSIEFWVDNKVIIYKRVTAYQGYNNKKLEKNKLWLKEIKSGFMTLYTAFQSGMNSPDRSFWFCRKRTDTVAYFMTLDYSGGLVFTVGANSCFMQNASKYFQDYPEIIEKIRIKEYKYTELEKIVDEYNIWMSTH